MWNNELKSTNYTWLAPRKVFWICFGGSKLQDAWCIGTPKLYQSLVANNDSLHAQTFDTTDKQFLMANCLRESTAIIAILQHTGGIQALSCYFCIEDSQPDCGDPFSGNASLVTNCPSGAGKYCVVRFVLPPSLKVQGKRSPGWSWNNGFLVRVLCSTGCVCASQQKSLSLRERRWLPQFWRGESKATCSLFSTSSQDKHFSLLEMTTRTLIHFV